jgi:DNA ligase-1
MNATLYSFDKKGNIRQWSIEIKDSQYRTIHGLLNGKIQTSEWKKVETKNEGRSNFRDKNEQALSEVNSIIKKQKEKKWFNSIEDLKKSEVEFEPMLAQKYEDRINEISFPIFSQPKMDGIRLIASSSSLLSRNRKEFVSIPHLLYIKQICKKYNIILDGELYNHSFKHDFNKITSIVKKTKPTKEDLKESNEKIQYWIYDCILLNDINASFEKRQSFLKSINEFKENVTLVETLKCLSTKEIDLYYEKYLTNGFEGQMIRVNSMYEQKRSKFLLKRKEFCDSEYKIIDICEGKGNKSGMAGYFILETNNTTFHSNIKGNRDFLIDLLKNKKQFIEKQATVKYFNLTPDGIPRFPYVIGIRDYE